jgi:hypothetical protein
MADSSKARYVDANTFIMAIQNCPTVVGNYGYSSDPLTQAINQTMSRAIMEALEQFKRNLSAAVYQASVPYDKCMLCVQKDACIPEHPLGDNR